MPPVLAIFPNLPLAADFQVARLFPLGEAAAARWVSTSYIFTAFLCRCLCSFARCAGQDEARVRET